ncbi:uncharacterized protein C8Q71DRAFT_861158 [Rhodofomes roseus]|uniref:DUF6532 domain-containing protein n=1 Tax=Rhodofomes roseus TaxID=34475 RepID=A0ABQ8K5J1_9APHY|nr:uncharacterized protein C8Q71DRAFT_861158 [Rhodofomes roseus]KAH9832259.1 hypothetical protein C8Q71DRAFT_861158 [Rhodofomes roseus]
MTKGQRGKKKRSLNAEGLIAQGTSAKGDVSHEAPRAKNVPIDTADGIYDLQRELRSLKRAERDAFEQAREEDIANPTITRPRAAKTKAYDVRIWKPKAREPKPDVPEPSGEPASGSDTVTKQVKPSRMGTGQGQPSVVTEEMSKSSLPTQTSRAQASARSKTVTVDPEISDGELEYVTMDNPQRMDDVEKISPRTDSDLDQQHRERVAAGNRRPSIDDGEGSEAESNGRGSDAEEYESGADLESEEDFGVQGGYAPSSRKTDKVAAQLKQGSVKVVSNGRNSRRVLQSDSETGGSDYAPDFLEPDYESPSDHESAGARDSGDEAQVAQEGPAKYRNLDGSVDHEWKEMIIHRGQRPKLPAIRHYVQQADENVTPSSEEYRRNASLPQPPSKPALVSSKKHSATSQHPDLARQTINDEVATTKTKRQGSFRQNDTQAPGGLISSEEDSAPPAYRRGRPGANKPRRASGKQPTAVVSSNRSIPASALAHTAAPGARNERQASREGAHSGSESDDGDDAAADHPQLLLASDENVWPEDTDVTFVENGKKVAGLNSQTSLKVRTLLKSTIAQELPQALALVNAFPNVGERPKMFLDIFIASTRRLGSNYTTIAQRLLQDSAYVIGLLYLPTKRMCSIRGPWYGACRDAVWEGYGLKAVEDDPEALQKAVEALLLNHQFICPGKLVNGKYTEFKRDLPFCAEPIINLTNILFLGPKAVCPIKDSVFTSSIKTGPESEKREIPQAMAALLATFAGAAIGEGLHGTREPLQDRENEGFNSIKQETPYRDHLATLSTLHPMGRHKILGYIFKEAKTAHMKRGAAQTRTTTASAFVDPMTAGMDIDL